MSTANRSSHDTPHSADVLAPRHRIPEEVTLHAKVTVGIRRKVRQRGPSPTPAALRQCLTGVERVSVPRSVGYVLGPGHPRSMSSWQRRAPCGAFGDGKDLESPMTHHSPNTADGHTAHYRGHREPAGSGSCAIGASDRTPTAGGGPPVRHTNTWWGAKNTTDSSLHDPLASRRLDPRPGGRGVSLQ